MEDKITEMTIISAWPLDTLGFNTAYARASINNGSIDPQQTPVNNVNGANCCTWNHVMKFPVDDAALHRQILEIEILTETRKEVGDIEIGHLNVPLRFLVEPGCAKFFSLAFDSPGSGRKGILKTYVKTHNQLQQQLRVYPSHPYSTYLPPYQDQYPPRLPLSFPPEYPPLPPPSPDPLPPPFQGQYPPHLPPLPPHQGQYPPALPPSSPYQGQYPPPVLPSPPYQGHPSPYQSGVPQLHQSSMCMSILNHSAIEAVGQVVSQQIFGNALGFVDWSLYSGNVPDFGVLGQIFENGFEFGN